MSPLPTFFRLPYADGPVLVRVAPRSSSKSRPLDLELRATDDVRAFVLPRGPANRAWWAASRACISASTRAVIILQPHPMSHPVQPLRPAPGPATATADAAKHPAMQHSKVSRYKTEGSALSDEEWESTLTSLLLGTEPTAHLHVAAQFTDENLGIEIGNRVSGATNIAGTLVLRPSKSATKNADMFAWADEAVVRQAQLAEELAQLKLKHAELHELVTKETANVQALVRNKEEFESEHDSFFRDLLNEKKLKIRAQEQILSTAHVDEARLAALNAKAKPGRSEAVASSRKGKRKAESLADEATDDEDDIDKMDVDGQSSSPGQELSDVEQTTDEETASEPEPEPRSKNPTRSTGGKKAWGGSSPSASKPVTKPDKPPSSNLRGKSPAVSSGNKDEEMPAPRALPFSRKAKPVPDPVDDESTASES